MLDAFERGGHVQAIRRAQAPDGGLGRRPSPHQRAGHLHRWPDRCRGASRCAPTRQAGRLHPPLPPGTWRAGSRARANSTAIGSIGVAVDDADEGITSPDYVVFPCKSGLLPEYVYHYLRSEAGRHEINLKTKGSVRFRLYYKQLAGIAIPVPEDLELQTQFAAL